MTEPERIIDNQGAIRRLGSLVPPEGFVQSFETFEGTQDVWDDATIRAAITDPTRTPRRAMFDDYWMTNQRSHGSCNGFAGAGALSKARYLRGIGDKIKLSGAFLYSLINGGRDQGSMLHDGLREVEKTGICEESFADWDDIYPSRWKPGAKGNAAKHKGLKAYACTTRQGFRTALAKGFPCVVAVHAGGRFQTLDRNGIAGVDNGRGNHAVHCDDIVLIGGEEVYDHVNSWGLGYGDRGRSYLRWASFEQTFGIHQFYAIASTEES